MWRTRLIPLLGRYQDSHSLLIGVSMLYHFVYKTTHPNGRYYIGRHTTENINDGYLGSGVWVGGIKNKSLLTREILSYAESSSELKMLEESKIKEHCDDPMCMNRGQGSNGWTSEEAHNQNTQRVADGTHNFLGGEIPRKNQQRRVENGTHQFLGDRNPVHERLRNGSHEWLSEQHKELTSQRNKQRFENKTHHLLKISECPHCGKTGQMTAMKRWHFENCKNQEIARMRRG
jgi:hypothetical protein